MIILYIPFFSNAKDNSTTIPTIYLDDQFENDESDRKKFRDQYNAYYNVKYKMQLNTYPIHEFYYYVEEKPLTLDEARQLFMQNKFFKQEYNLEKTADENRPVHFSQLYKKHLWLMFKIKNVSGINEYILYSSARTANIECYVFDKNGKYLEFKIGENFSFKNRDIFYAKPAYSLILEKNEVYTFFIRYNSQLKESINIYLITPRKLLNLILKGVPYTILLYGIILAMILYNLILFFYLKDRTYLFYTCFIFCWLMVHVTRNGYTFQYLWPFPAKLIDFGSISDTLFLFFASLNTALGLLFLKTLIKNRKSFLNKLVYIYVSIRISFFIITKLFLSGYFPLYTGLPVILFDISTCSVIFLLMFFNYKNDKKLSNILILSYSPLILSTFYTIFIKGILAMISIDLYWVINGFIYDFWFFRILFDQLFGLAFQAVILALGLAYRINIIRAEGLYNSRKAKILEELNRQKSNFFVNLAHEMKTPLTLIQNYLNRYIETSGLSGEMDLKVVQQNFSKLTRDFLNFLDTEKLERGQIFYDHDQIFNLSGFIEQKCLLFKELACKKNIMLKKQIEENLFIKADPSAIDRILNNLLENAIRYTEKNGDVELILQANKKFLQLIVKDTGIGISEEQQQNIFSPYYQISHQKRNIQGIGMGLFIIKNIIEVLSGKITVSSKLFEGSCFQVNLPRYRTNDSITAGDIEFEHLQPIEMIEEPEIMVLDYDNNKKNILIVEDEKNMLVFLVDSLKTRYNIYFAVNGKDALEKLASIPKPQLIISDIMMDIMNGEEFLSHLQKNKEFCDIPFIFLTAKTSQLEKIKGISIGAIDYIYKPFSIEELKVKIEAVLKNRERQRKSDKREFITKLSRFIDNEVAGSKRVSLEKICEKFDLTDREKEVMIKIAEDKSNKEIADELFVTEATIKSHVSSIYKKCQVKNRRELKRLLQKEIYMF